MPHRPNQHRKSDSRPRGTTQRYQKKAARQRKNRKLSSPPLCESQNDQTAGQATSNEGIHQQSGQRNTFSSDKLARIEALHAQWELEDLATSLQDAELEACQKKRCKEIGMIVFGFSLREAQINAVWTLFYQKKDLLLLARTGFGKSLIFQLIPFMPEPTGVVIILMPLKLLQAEQNATINRLPKGKAIALTGDNNQKETHLVEVLVT